jgi:hypothetical protein
MTQGTLVDATIIQAPSSTKNKHNSRDEDMNSVQLLTILLSAFGTNKNG